jgi:hypothetical protein
MNLVEAFFSMNPKRTRVCKGCSNLRKHYVDEIVASRPSNILYYCRGGVEVSWWKFHGDLIARLTKVGETTFGLDLMSPCSLFNFELVEKGVERLNRILAYLRDLGLDLPNMRFRARNIKVAEYVGKMGYAEFPVVYLERDGRKLSTDTVCLLLDFEARGVSVGTGGLPFTFLDEGVDTRFLQRVYEETLVADYRAYEAYWNVKREFGKDERVSKLEERLRDVKMKFSELRRETGLPTFLYEGCRPFNVIASLRALQKEYEAYVDECKRTLAELRLLS